jgi:hypothetical protein
MTTPFPCPFCGAHPQIIDGTAWAAVRCENPACHAQPAVNDGEPYPERPAPTEAFKESAILRWNQRSSGAGRADDSMPPGQ